MVNTPDRRYWPDWADIGKEVIITTADGAERKGLLDCYDVFFTESDKIPLLRIIEPDGAAVDFTKAESWRLANPR